MRVSPLRAQRSEGTNSDTCKLWDEHKPGNDRTSYTAANSIASNLKQSPLRRRIQILASEVRRQMRERCQMARRRQGAHRLSLTLGLP